MSFIFSALVFCRSSLSSIASASWTQLNYEYTAVTIRFLKPKLPFLLKRLAKFSVCVEKMDGERENARIYSSLSGSLATSGLTAGCRKARCPKMISAVKKSSPKHTTGITKSG